MSTNIQSLEIKFNSMSKPKTKEEQEKYFEEEYGSIAKVFMKWRDSKVDDFGRHLFPLDNLEKMIKFYKKDKLQPKIGMLLQILGRCSEEDIGDLMTNLKKHDTAMQMANNLSKMRDTQSSVKPLNTKF